LPAEGLGEGWGDGGGGGRREKKNSASSVAWTKAR
jgi:hypothetical protein